ncbi:patatin-like phospholipase, putative [Plasmodium reichenowi]|uniref:Patatin-like phospholipase, putative n=1 Tax=Plasmodium reichenowi TaxID=5854 RepID=A0A151LHT5_PLARE|nr:patatin-like phospholipase, putative [Plasmodium reichenowi]KYN98530.1 patatin-like phospholipase, putative [Plasmodium reichenowi]
MKTPEFSLDSLKNNRKKKSKKLNYENWSAHYFLKLPIFVILMIVFSLNAFIYLLIRFFIYFFENTSFWMITKYKDFHFFVRKKKNDKTPSSSSSSSSSKMKYNDNNNNDDEPILNKNEKDDSIFQIERLMNTCNNYDDYIKYAYSMDVLTGKTVHINENDDYINIYDVHLLKKTSESIQTNLLNKDILLLLEDIKIATSPRIKGIFQEKYYCKTYSIPHLIVTEFINNVMNGLNFLENYIEQQKQININYKFSDEYLVIKKYFKDIFRQWGNTALFLSGGAILGLHHFGVLEVFLKSSIKADYFNYYAKKLTTQKKKKEEKLPRNSHRNDISNDNNKNDIHKDSQDKKKKYIILKSNSNNEKKVSSGDSDKKKQNKKKYINRMKQGIKKNIQDNQKEYYDYNNNRDDYNNNVDNYNNNVDDCNNNVDNYNNNVDDCNNNVDDCNNNVDNCNNNVDNCNNNVDNCNNNVDNYNNNVDDCNNNVDDHNDFHYDNSSSSNTSVYHSSICEDFNLFCTDQMIKLKQYNVKDKKKKSIMNFNTLCNNITNHNGRSTHINNNKVPIKQDGDLNFNKKDINMNPNNLKEKQKNLLFDSLNKFYNDSEQPNKNGNFPLTKNNENDFVENFEDNILPQIICGTSAGSIVAAWICTRTNNELLHEFNINFIYNIVSCFSSENWFYSFFNIYKKGNFYDIDKIVKLIYNLYGDMTFLEAFIKTNLVLNITVTRAECENNNFSCDEDGHIVLNYMNSPNVLIYTAVLASCSFPYLLQPFKLLEKKYNKENVYRFMSIKEVNNSKLILNSNTLYKNRILLKEDSDGLALSRSLENSDIKSEKTCNNHDTWKHNYSNSNHYFNSNINLDDEQKNLNEPQQSISNNVHNYENKNSSCATIDTCMKEEYILSKTILENEFINKPINNNINKDYMQNNGEVEFIGKKNHHILSKNNIKNNDNETIASFFVSNNDLNSTGEKSKKKKKIINNNNNNNNNDDDDHNNNMDFPDSLLDHKGDKNDFLILREEKKKKDNINKNDMNDYNTCDDNCDVNDDDDELEDEDDICINRVLRNEIDRGDILDKEKITKKKKNNKDTSSIEKKGTVLTDNWENENMLIEKTYENGNLSNKYIDINEYRNINLLNEEYTIINSVQFKNMYFHDGSLKSDIPAHNLNQILSVKYKIVSQVNPHVFPFTGVRVHGEAGKPVKWRGSSGNWRAGFLMSSMEILFKENMRYILRLMALLDLSPTIRGLNAGSIAMQNYNGDITLHPKRLYLKHFKLISVSNYDDVEWYIQQGRQMTFQKLPLILNRMKIEKKLIKMKKCFF